MGSVRGCLVGCAPPSHPHRKIDPNPGWLVKNVLWRKVDHPPLPRRPEGAWGWGGLADVVLIAVAMSTDGVAAPGPGEAAAGAPGRTGAPRRLTSSQSQTKNTEHKIWKRGESQWIFDQGLFLASMSSVFHVVDLNSSVFAHTPTVL